MPGFSIKRYERAAAAYDVLAHQLNGKVVVKLEGHTTAHYVQQGVIAITLHETDILTFYEDGRVRFDTGGWPTMFTNQRMVKYAPEGLSVYSDRGKWMLFVQEGDERGVGNTYRLYDGITVDLNTRQVVSKDPGTAEWDAWNKEIDKKIKAYVAALTHDVGQNDVDPSYAVCSDCYPREREDVIGQKWVEENGTEHYLRHIEAGEYPHWMIYNCFVEAMYAHPADMMLYYMRDGDMHEVHKVLTKFLRRRLYKGVTAVR